MSKWGQEQKRYKIKVQVEDKKVLVCNFKGYTLVHALERGCYESIGLQPLTENLGEHQATIEIIYKVRDGKVKYTVQEESVGVVDTNLLLYYYQIKQKERKI